jgi:hypothetical protein
VTRGSHSSERGRNQFRRPRSFITEGKRTARTTVASMKTATARPIPTCLNSSAESVAKTEKTAIMIAAALVTTPAVVLIPWPTALRGVEPGVEPLADPAEDEDVVVALQWGARGQVAGDAGEGGLHAFAARLPNRTDRRSTAAIRDEVHARGPRRRGPYASWP